MNLDMIGGRKFLLTLIILGLASVIELKTDRGISQQMVALLIGVLGVFSAANAHITSKTLGLQKVEVTPLTEGDSKEPEVSEQSIPEQVPQSSLVEEALHQVLINQREHSEVLNAVAKGVTNTNAILATVVTGKR